jgi:hypothetical protein
MTDFLTVVTPVPIGNLTKRISKHGDQTVIKSQAGHLRFKSEQVQINDIYSLAEVLQELEKNPNAAVLRGMLSEEADQNKHYRRKWGRRSDGTGAYLESDHRWVMLDMDSVPLDMVGIDPVVDPEGCALAVVGLLPPAWHDASFYWQYGSSQGFKEDGSVSLHLWFWLDCECSDIDIRRYFSTANDALKVGENLDRSIIDISIFDSIQLHFTAAPILKNVEDVLPQRSGLYVGEHDEVRLSKEWIFSVKEGKYLEYLSRLGDDKDGFHYPILQAVASFVSEFGKPDIKSMRELKGLIRGNIDSAQHSVDRGKDIDRYKSDNYLDQLIQSAVEKGFQKIVSQDALKEAMDTYVWVSSTDTFYNVGGDLEIKSTAMNFEWAHRTGGKPIVPMLIVNPDFRKVQIIQTVPGEYDKICRVDGKTVYNTWAGRPLDPTDGDVSIFTEHLKYLVDYDQDAYGHLSSYLAHCIANPGKKIRHALVIGSENTGTGKSYLKHMARHVMGSRNITEVNNDMIKEQYNGWAISTELVFVEELMAAGRLEIANKLKPLLSETTIAVRKMFTNPFYTRSYANFIAFTNHINAAVLHDKDRRYWVWFSEAEPRDKEYYNQLFGWTKKCASDIYGWALNYDLSNFDPSAPAPETKHREEMEALSEDPIKAFIRRAIEEESWPMKYDLVIVRDLIEVIPSRFKISETKLSMVLKKVGALNLGQKRMKDGSKPRVWAIRNQKQWEAAAEKDVTDKYKRPGRYDDTIGVDF